MGNKPIASFAEIFHLIVAEHECLGQGLFDGLVIYCWDAYIVFVIICHLFYEGDFFGYVEILCATSTSTSARV